MISLLRFALPMGLWLWLMRDFLSGTIPANMDTNTIYGVTKYYFNNLLNGTVPLWEPFVALGRPFYAIAICNLFNPVTQLVLILKLMGVDYYSAFLTYITVYFFIGCIGFYWLAKEAFNDKRLAYLGFIALLFSSFGVSIFTQMTFLELLVPAIWFFFFLLRFARMQTPGNFAGICYCLMIMMISYLPFYVATVIGVFAVLCALIYPQRLWQFIAERARFKLKHMGLVLACGLGVVIAAAPLIVYKIADKGGDVVSPGRHCQYTSQEECYERTMKDHGGMSYEEITRSGTLGERLDLGYLFAHLDKLTYGSDSLYFLPLMIYLLIWLGLFLKANRLTVLLTGMIALIGIVGLGDATPVYRWLYDHLPFFGYFRNLFFFGSFLIPLMILLALQGLQGLMNLNTDTHAKRKGMMVGITVMHGLFFLFLRRYDGVMPSAWLTLGLSAAAFMIYYGFGHRIKPITWSVVFGLLLMIHPAQVISAYAANALEFRCALPAMHVKPSFQWVRPKEPPVSQCRIYQFVPYEDFWYAMNMSDATARVGYPQSAARWTFEASQQLGQEALAEYARYKIYVADSLDGPATPLLSPSDYLQVKAFDTNRLVLAANLTAPKWIIYNDSYASYWKAFINGRPVPLVRANTAFKAVQVPAGEVIVEFRYCPPGGQWVYMLTTAALFIFLMVTLCLIFLK